MDNEKETVLASTNPEEANAETNIFLFIIIRY